MAQQQFMSRERKQYGRTASIKQIARIEINMVLELYWRGLRSSRRWPIYHQAMCRVAWSTLSFVISASQNWKQFFVHALGDPDSFYLTDRHHSQQFKLLAVESTIPT